MSIKMRTMIFALATAAVLGSQLPSKAAKQRQPQKQMMKIGEDTVSLETGKTFVKAQDLLNNKHVAEAAELLKQVVESEPNSAAARYKYGFALLLQGKYTDALDQAKKCTELSPKFFGGWALLGESSINLNLDTQAKAAYEKALEIQPDGENSEIIREHLNDLTTKKETVASEPAEDPLVAAQNRNIMKLNKALALCDQANNNLKQKQFEQGLQKCRNALTIAPDASQVKENFVVYMNNYAADCVQKQNLKQAEALMKEALAIQAKGDITAQSRITTLKNYSALLNFLGRTSEAKQIEAQMKSIATP